MPSCVNRGERRAGVTAEEYLRHDSQMSGRRDGQELGQALHEAQDHGLEPGHRFAHHSPIPADSNGVTAHRFRVSGSRFTGRHATGAHGAAPRRHVRVRIPRLEASAY